MLNVIKPVGLWRVVARVLGDTSVHDFLIPIIYFDYIANSSLTLLKLYFKSRYPLIIFLIALFCTPGRERAYAISNTMEIL